MALVGKDVQRSAVCLRIQAGREHPEPLLYPLHAVWEAEDATPHSRTEEVPQVGATTVCKYVVDTWVRKQCGAVV